MPTRCPSFNPYIRGRGFETAYCYIKTPLLQKWRAGFSICDIELMKEGKEVDGTLI